MEAARTLLQRVGREKRKAIEAVELGVSAGEVVGVAAAGMAGRWTLEIQVDLGSAQELSTSTSPVLAKELHSSL